MTFYVLDAIRELEGKFSLVASILLKKYAQLDGKPCDILSECSYSLQQRYKYLIEDNLELMKETNDAEEFIMKVSSSINFMNSFELLEFLARKLTDKSDVKLLVGYLKDVQRTLSCVSVSDFADLWVASVPAEGNIELTLELDQHWHYKSLEDLKNLHFHYPYRYWHFKKVSVTDGTIKVIYAVPRSTRLYQIEQNSLTSDDIIAVYVGSERILDLTSEHIEVTSMEIEDNLDFGIDILSSCRELVVVSDDTFQIQKKSGAVHKPCTVYSACPLSGRSCFEMEVSVTSACPIGKLMIGVCRLPKNSNWCQSSLLYESNNCCVWHGGAVWNNLSVVSTKVTYGTVHLTNLNHQDRIGFTISLAGDLSFYVNGECQGVAARNVYMESCDVYAVATMLEGCDSMSVLKAATEQDMRLVDLCVASIAGWLHTFSDIKLLPLPESVIDRIHANVMFKQNNANREGICTS